MKVLSCLLVPEMAQRRVHLVNQLCDEFAIAWYANYLVTMGVGGPDYVLSDGEICILLWLFEDKHK
jgi:hypothetical protein